SQSRPASIMAALNAQIVDAFGQIENVVALEAQIVKCILPLAAGVEMADFPLVPSFADLDIPRTEPRALKTGTQHDAILVQATGFIGYDCAPPVQLGDRAPGIPMADAFFLLRNRIDARLYGFSPAQPSLDERRLVVHLWSPGTPNNDGLQLFGAHHR